MSVSFLINVKDSKDNQEGKGYLALLEKARVVIFYFLIYVLAFKGTYYVQLGKKASSEA